MAATGRREPDLSDLTDPQLLELMRRTAMRADDLNRQASTTHDQFTAQRAELAKRRP